MYIYIHFTSHEDTLILLDENHVSKLLATCVSVGSLTAVTIERISTQCWFLHGFMMEMQCKYPKNNETAGC